MHVFHEPVKDRNVTVDRNVNVIQRLLITEVLLEILHGLEQECLIASKVLCAFFGLITDMNQHLVLRRAHYYIC